MGLNWFTSRRDWIFTHKNEAKEDIVAAPIPSAYDRRVFEVRRKSSELYVCYRGYKLITLKWVSI